MEHLAFAHMPAFQENNLFVRSVLEAEYLQEPWWFCLISFRVVFHVILLFYHPWTCFRKCLSSTSTVIKVRLKVKVTVMLDSLQPHGLYSPWNSPGWNTGMGSYSLLQGIFPTQGLNPGLLHCRWILYQLSHHGSPRILEWAAYPFSRGSSQPRSQTRVSHIADGFFTSWATSEALKSDWTQLKTRKEIRRPVNQQH